MAAKHIREDMYFNSQPHKEADNFYLTPLDHYIISTHSLTRRLTVAGISSYMDNLFQLTASQGG